MAEGKLAQACDAFEASNRVEQRAGTLIRLGECTIPGHSPGHEEWQTIAHVPVEGAKVSVEVPKFKELSTLLAPTPPAVTKQPVLPEPEPVRSPGMFTTKRKIAVATAATSVI